MSTVEHRVKELVEEKIADRQDLFLVSVKMHPGGKLEVLLDGDQGLDIGDCAAVSRHVGFHLEEEDVVGHAYRLEVSSPGIDTPLVSERQYQKNIGRNVHVIQQDGSAHEGELVAVTGAHITILVKIKEKGKKTIEQQRDIPLLDIRTIKVVISFK